MMWQRVDIRTRHMIFICQKPSTLLGKKLMRGGHDGQGAQAG